MNKINISSITTIQLKARLQNRRQKIALSFLVFLIVYCVKIILVKAYGVNIPFSDQWDNQIPPVYFKYLDGNLDWHDIWTQGNEHRVVFTKLLNLGVFIFSGRYFNHVNELIAQSLVFSLIPAILVYVAVKSEFNWVSVLGITMIFIPPISTENLYWSYQSQIYFALLFACIGIYFISHRSVAIIPITLVTILGGFSNASAFYIPFIAAVAVFLDRRGQILKWLSKVLYFLVLSFFTYKIFVAKTPWHDVFIAKSVKAALKSLIMFSSFPDKVGLLIYLIVFLNGAYLFFQLVNKRPLSFANRYCFFAIVWFSIFLASSSYARAGFPSIPSRYFDYYLIPISTLFMLGFASLDSERRHKSILVFSLFLFITVGPLFIDSLKESAYIKSRQDTYYANMIKTLKDIHINKKLETHEQVVAALKKTPRPYYSGYPNYERPARVLFDSRSKQIFLRLDSSTSSSK